MTIEQTILEVGGQGGSIRLVGVEESAAWRFRVVADAPGFSALRDGDQRHVPAERSWVTTWGGALSQFDSYPWTNLYPLEVHPAFRSKVAAAMKTRPKPALELFREGWQSMLDAT
jgi:hypothetical protein